MILYIALIIFLLWATGRFVFNVAGDAINLLLLIGVVLILVHVFKRIGGKGSK